MLLQIIFYFQLLIRERERQNGSEPDAGLFSELERLPDAGQQRGEQILFFTLIVQVLCLFHIIYLIVYIINLFNILD